MSSGISATLQLHADRRPDHLAIECEGDRISWGELRERVSRTAGALAGAGVERGDVVAVLLHNSPTFLEAMYACSHLGAVFMPLNWRLAPAELNYIINHARTTLLVTEAELSEMVRDAGELCCERIVSIDADPGGGWLELAELRDEADPIDEPEWLERDDLARLMYTSGTTSRPKGVMITCGNLEAKNLAHQVEFGITADDRTLVCGPLYHVGGLDMTTTTVLHQGGSAHILRRFDPAKVLDAIEDQRITHLWMAPAMIRMTLEQPVVADSDLSSVVLLSDGGEKMPLPLIERVLEAFPNAWFADAYGMTETVSGDTFLDKRFARDKLGSVGKPVFNVDLRIVDENDRPVPANTPGEIVMRGPKVCKGYIHDPEASAKALRGGWLHTGDIGVLDADGFLYVVDRLKDMILSGGENIASSEVERVLHEHGAVTEVAVVGRPSERWQEVPVAYLVCPADPPSSAELNRFCAERLAAFKVPKHFRFVSELPRNPSGKVLKRELRELELAEPGGD